MAHRQLTLTESESITKAGVTTNFNLARISNFNIDFDNKIIRSRYTVGHIPDTTYVPVREGQFTISEDTTFDTIIFGKTDSQIQDGIFDEMVTAEEVGAGTKGDI